MCIKTISYFKLPVIMIGLLFLQNIQIIYAQQERYSGLIDSKTNFDEKLNSVNTINNFSLPNNKIPLSSSFFFTTDTTLTKNSDTARAYRRPIGLRIAEEAGVGTLTGLAGTVAGAYTGASLSNKKDLDALVPGFIGAYVGYLAGSSLGVYLIAKNINPNVSYLVTLGTELLGGFVGLQLFSASNQKGILSASPIIIPLLAGIIYSELIR